MKPKNTTIYSFYKANEGGPGQRFVLAQLKDAGIEAKLASSIYVGQTAVLVSGNKKIQRRAARIIFPL